MNDLGEFYSGTKKLSSATGEEKVIDAPIITFTGDDAQGENQNRSSGIFDDVIIKEGITIEGGENGNQSSQFYGPVNFTKKVTNTSDEGINTNNLYIKGTAPQGKLITVGISTPTTAEIPSPKDGDISLIQPPSGGYIGQAYVNNEWKKFGLVSNSADILDIKVDRLGIGDPITFTNQNETIDATVKLYVAGKSKFEDVTFLSAPNFANGVTLNNTNFAGLNINGTARFTGTGGTTYSIYVNDPINLAGAGSTCISRLYNLEVAGSAGIGTTNPTTKLDVIGSSYISDKLGIGITNPTEKLEVDGNINLVSSGNYIKKTFADDTEEYILRGPTLSSYYPIITYTRSTGTATRGFRFGTHDNIGNRSDWMSIWNGAVGIGTTNPTSKLVVNGTIGIDGSSSTAGRTQLSSSASGFVINHNHNSSIIIQNQSADRLTIGAGGTVTVTTSNTGTETRGTFVRLTNAGGGDSVISWDSTLNNPQRWYAGIDVSDGASWKLAKPILTDFDDENFDRATNTIDQTETKLKIDTSGTATFLGGLNAARTNNNPVVSSNTYNFTVAGATGNTVIAGTLNTSSNKFSVDASGNVTAAGKITGSSLEITTGTATFGSTVSVQSSVTAGSFVKKNATATNFLKAGGTDAALTGAEVIKALDYTPANIASLTGSLPKGNSLICNQLTFNENQKEYLLTFGDPDPARATPFKLAGGPANLLVSLGGVIQRAGTDYNTIITEGSNNPDRIYFINNGEKYAPSSTLSNFIVALGGQGSLFSNVDWDKKGEIFVATGDNTATQLKVPEVNNVAINDYILTTDKSTTSGLAWKSEFAGNAASATTVADLAISTGKIANGAVTAEKLDSATASNGKGKRTVSASEPSGGVDGDIWYVGQTPDGKTITAAQIVDKSITAAQIADGTITATQLSSSINFFPVGGIIMWSGTVANIPTGWALCNGSNSTPDLRNKFIVGATSDASTGVTFDADTGTVSGAYAPGNTGGETAHKLTIAELASHNHNITLPLGRKWDLQGNDLDVPNFTNTQYTSDSTGGDKYHENRPPYYALAFIMKVS
jgi:hypothetical protein